MTVTQAATKLASVKAGVRPNVDPESIRFAVDVLPLVKIAILKLLASPAMLVKILEVPLVIIASGINDFSVARSVSLSPVAFIGITLAVDPFAVTVPRAVEPVALESLIKRFKKAKPVRLAVQEPAFIKLLVLGDFLSFPVLLIVFPVAEVEPGLLLVNHESESVAESVQYLPVVKPLLI